MSTSQHKKFEITVPNWSADKLLEARVRLGLTRAQLAKLLEINTSTVQRWESAEKPPKRAKLVYSLLLKYLENEISDSPRNEKPKSDLQWLNAFPPCFVLFKTPKKKPLRHWTSGDVRNLRTHLTPPLLLKDLARLCGVAVPTAANWELSANTKPPTGTSARWLNVLRTRGLERLTFDPWEKTIELTSGKDLMIKDVLCVLDADGHIMQDWDLLQAENKLTLISRATSTRIDSLSQYTPKQLRQLLRLEQATVAKLFNATPLSVINWEKSKVCLSRHNNKFLKGPVFRLYEILTFLGSEAEAEFADLITTAKENRAVR